MTRHPDRPPFDPLEGCLWPDPDIHSRKHEPKLVLDDVSRQSATPVDRLWCPATTEDVLHIVNEAQRNGKSISIRGTQHSMGGHSLSQGGYVVDTRYLNRRHYDPVTDCVTCGVGCTWADIIYYLDGNFGKSPQVLQSYVSFSVGGTLAVNAHGITSDETLVSSVERFRLVRYDEAEQAAVVLDCTRDDELFGLAIGGYGLFGIITEVTLRVTDNSILYMDSLVALRLQCDETNDHSIDDDQRCEFVRIWDACRQDETVDIKLARLQILTLETASLYVFRKDISPKATVTANLPLQPRELSPQGRLLYKWALPLLKEYRYSAEEQTGQAVDMPPGDRGMTRNEVLWESAVPLAKLFSPLLVVEDTFILQEYFVPHGKFEQWIAKVRPIYKAIDTYQKEGKPSDDVPAQSLILLNTTIRYVEKDYTTCLNYSQAEEGMFAFVLYFRIKRNNKVEHDLGLFHNRFAQEAIRLDGTFYLPYRKCYTPDLLARAYPQIREFAAKKEQSDPRGLFSNQWFEHYVLPLCSVDYKIRHRSIPQEKKPDQQRSSIISKEEFMEWLPYCEERRNNSYRSLLRDPRLRKLFSEEFLVKIFNVGDPASIMRMITRAAADPRNGTDLAVYSALRKLIAEDSSGPVAALSQGWRGLRQLSHQKTELAQETASILHRLGLFGRIATYLSIGDHGKTVRNYREIGLLARTEASKVYVAHTFDEEADESSLTAVLERGSLDPVGDIRINYDYMQDDVRKRFAGIPSCSIDLVTLHQGLHHFPSEYLYDFLVEVRRVLRHGGAFIFREHNLDNDGTFVTGAPVAILDLAHSVFNAVMGVDEEEEASEKRAFRPLEEWRSMMASLGFADSMLYGLESGDCTADLMLCFCKDKVCTVAPLNIITPVEPREVQDDSSPQIIGIVQALLAQVPTTVADVVESVLTRLLQYLPILQDGLRDFLLETIPEAIRYERSLRAGSAAPDTGLNLMGTMLQDVEGVSKFSQCVEQWISEKVANLLNVGHGANNLLHDIKIRETTNIAGLLDMHELSLILPVLKRKSLACPNDVGEFEKYFVALVEAYAPALILESGRDDVETDTAHPPGDTPLGSQTMEESENPENVSADEVLQVINELSEHIPGLLDPNVILAESGLTVAQQSALVGGMIAPDLARFADNIAGYHDGSSWQELRARLVGDNMSTVSNRGDLPTKERLFSKELGHPWYHALYAFLKGPGIRLKQQTLVGLRFLGLTELCAMYRAAKADCGKERVRSHTEADLLGNVDSRQLRAHLEDLASHTEYKTLRILFDGSNVQDLQGVGWIVKAEFGYKSLTSSLTDVTADLQTLHSEVLAGGGPTGWLPIRENTLIGFRNKGAAKKVGDSLRRVVIGSGTLGLVGKNVLKLTYIPVLAGCTSQELNTVERICSFTEEKGLVSPDLHPNDGHYTWLKLSEWMQVEVIDLFTKSLDHTPWYHFPYFEFLSLYFRVLFRECRIVASQHGLLQAYGSMAFFTDLVPGIVMSFLFAQLKALAYPLQVKFPMYNPEHMIEEILLYGSLSIPERQKPLQFFRETIDPRIRDVVLLSEGRQDASIGLFRLIVPTYKPMGEIIVRIGQLLPSARVLRISNQSIVQVSVKIDLESVASHSIYLERVVTTIEGIEGVEVAFRYRYPMDNQSHRDAGELQSRVLHLAVRAQVTSLLTLVRLTGQLDGVTLHQVFDFWAG